MIVLAIAVGAAIGAVLRALVYKATGTLEDEAFMAQLVHPTAVVNVAGSLLLGLFSGFAVAATVSDSVRELIATGFCGSFTTCSTFSLDTYNEIVERRWRRLSLYLGSNVVFGLGGAAVGFYVGKAL